MVVVASQEAVLGTIVARVVAVWAAAVELAREQRLDAEHAAEVRGMARRLERRDVVESAVREARTIVTAQALRVGRQEELEPSLRVCTEEGFGPRCVVRLERLHVCVEGSLARTQLALVRGDRLADVGKSAVELVALRRLDLTPARAGVVVLERTCAPR